MEFQDEGVLKVLVAVVESGTYIGESSLLGEIPLTDVVTQCDVKLLSFNVEK